MNHPLSYTRARTFDECPFKYKVEYVDGLRVPAEPYMIVGSIVHECADRYVKFLKEFKKSSDFEAMERIAREVWSNPVARRGLSESYWEEVLGLCVKAREMMVCADPSVVVGSELLLAVDDHGRFCPYNDAGAAIRGKIDRLDICGGQALVVDYKCGHRIEALEGNKQLATYAMLVKANYVSIEEVEICLTYFRTDVVKRGPIDQVDLERIAEWYPNIQRGIDWCTSSGTWPGRPGYACRGCGAFQTCPERAKAVKATPPPDEQAAVGMVERLILLDRERQELTEALRPWVDQYGNLEVNGMVLGLFLTQKLEFDPVKVWTMLADRGFPPLTYMRVDTKGIKKLGRRDRGLATALEAIARDRSTTSLKLKNLGEDD